MAQTEKPEKREHAEVEIPKHMTMREIEEMSLDEINALSPEQIALQLQRAELREKAMRLAQLSRDFKEQRQKQDDLFRRQNDRIMQEKDLRARKKLLQENCTHMKGGDGKRGAVLQGGGTDGSDYAVIHHQLPSGSLMIMCLRCGREEYSYNPLTGQAETPGFKDFSRLPTRNQSSGSTIFFPLGYRQPVKSIQ